MRSPGLARRIAAGAIVLSVAAVPVFGTMSQAAGDPIADKKAQAERISDEIQELRHQVERSANEYGAANQRVERLKAEAATTEARIDRARAEIGARKADLSRYAMNAYMSGGGDASLQSILDSEVNTTGARSSYTSAMVGDRQQIVDDLSAAEKVAKDEVAKLEEQRAEAEAARDQADRSRREAQASAERAQALEAQVKGELRQLVQEKIEADRRATERAAYERAQRDAAARRQSIPAAPANPGPPAAPTPARRRPGASQPPANQPPPSAVPGDTSLGARAVAVAQSKLGSRYVWGAAGPNTFDCSGLTQWSYRQVGVSIPRVTWDQEAAGRRMPISQIQPGDLVFYLGGDHMAMYVGNGTVIHAPYTGSVVKYGSLYMYPVDSVVRPY